MQNRQRLKSGVIKQTIVQNPFVPGYQIHEMLERMGHRASLHSVMTIRKLMENRGIVQPVKDYVRVSLETNEPVSQTEMAIKYLHKHPVAKWAKVMKDLGVYSRTVYGARKKMPDI